MSQERRTADIEYLVSRVRQNAGSAGIAAGLMIYFGFFSSLGEPTGADLFARANLAFYHTLRYGGVAMALIAAWSLFGHRPVLLVDAIVSVVIGASLALTGVAMLIDGGGMTQTVLNVFFGTLFVSAGVRNWRDYWAFAPVAEFPSGEVKRTVNTGPEARYDGAYPAPSDASLASRLRQRKAQSSNTTQAAQPGLPEPPARPGPIPPKPAPTSEPSTDEEDEKKGAQSDGFLASFADKEPPRRT